MDKIKLSEAERQAFSRSMVHLGPCTCQPIPGRWAGNWCPGHKFLSEQDSPHTNRMHKLLWIRRTLNHWQMGEWTGRCKDCGAENVAIAHGSEVCVSCSILKRVAEHGTDQGVLPW